MSRVPLNDLSRAADLDTLADLVSGVVASGTYIGGQEVARLEHDLAQLGFRNAVLVGSGTDALEVALRAVGCTPGCRVVTAANAGFYASTAILRLGGKPVYADVSFETASLTAATVADACRGAGPAAVVVTHLYGLVSPDLDELADWCWRRDLPLVEDCAQAIGARAANGRLAGTIGAACALSFYPTKNLAGLGDGGAVCTTSAAVAKRAHAIRQYGWQPRYVVTALGMNSRMDEIQAAVVRHRLPALQTRTDARSRIAARYADALPPTAGTLLWRPGPSCVSHLAVVAAKNRKEFCANLDGVGIDTAVHYPIPDHRQPLWGAGALTLPATDELCGRVVTVPCFPEMTENEVQRVCDALAQT